MEEDSSQFLSLPPSCRRYHCLVQFNNHCSYHDQDFLLTCSPSRATRKRTNQTIQQQQNQSSRPLSKMTTTVIFNQRLSSLSHHSKMPSWCRPSLSLSPFLVVVIFVFLISFISINEVVGQTTFGSQSGGDTTPVSDKLDDKFDIARFPPRDLQVEVVSGNIVHLEWRPPDRGPPITGYKLTLIPLSEQDKTEVRRIDRSIHDPFPLTLSELTPGASYEVQLHSKIRSSTSNLFLSANFTTKPSAPGRFIVWFRNETTLLVLWQPPYPSGIFDQYRVSITPEDAVQSVLYVVKGSDPPGPAQASFYGLVPGRAYNISVQTVSNNQISAPTEAQYRTVPLSPTNLTVDRSSITSTSFDVRWNPPKATSEFDRYQVSLGTKGSVAPKVVSKDAPRVMHFEEDLEPGKTYEIAVKTLSGNVASWPLTGNVTTRPLPVVNLRATPQKNNKIDLEWEANNNSIQDSFMVRYYEVEAFNSDGTVQVVQDTRVTLEDLLAGRNYSIIVVSVSNEVSSTESTVYQPTKPAPPVIGILEPVSGSQLNVSWKSDVTSRQDSFQVVWIRNDSHEKEEISTKNNWYLLENLYPGAGYEIKVYAVSYGLISEPHSYFQTIFPRPPENLQTVGSTNSSILLTWSPPRDSLVDHYIVRYRPEKSSFWRDLTVSNITSSEIRDLVAGERYVVRVSTVSNRVESPDVREIEQTLYPNVIDSVGHEVSSYNISFHWAIPLGSVDYYIIVYNTVGQPSIQLSKQVANRPSSAKVDVVIDGLTPGEAYTFHFYTVSNNLRSEGYTLTTRTMPVINSVINVVIDEQETRTLGIKYTPTPRKNVIFDRYRFQLVSDATIPVQEKLHNDTNRLVLFDNLIPGKLYNISIWTVSGGVLSVPVVREARLYPEPIRLLSPLKIGDTEIILTWEAPAGEKDGYEVTYLDPHVSNRLVRNITFNEKISYAGLRPHQNYSFVVTTLSGYGTSTMLRSTPISQTFTTLESTPGKVAFFQSTNTKPNEITLRWNLPQSEANGILTGFKVSYYVKGSTHVNHQLFEPTETQGTIYSLIPGKTYMFQIQAHTKVGPGSKAVWEEKMPIWAPPPPPDNVSPILVSQTSDTIKVKFKKTFFSSLYGPITAYTIIVAEDYTQPTDQSLELPSWFDVQKHAVWPPYQATEPFNPFNTTNGKGNVVQEEFTLGSERCDLSNISRLKFCNGPLKPGTVYKVKIRAFTRPEKFTDTVYSYAISTDPDNTALIVGISLPLSLLALLALVVIFLKHRRLGPFKHHKTSVRKGLATVSNNFLTARNGVTSVGGNDMLHGGLGGHHLHHHPLHLHHETLSSLPDGHLVDITSRPIKLKDFADHFRHMSADSDFRFSEEFELLKHVGRDKPCTAADLPVNRPKNRFTNILPYDHSRVKLLPSDDEEGSDYLNANYIPGFSSPREFIVTQGPLHSTRDDFWRCVWEQNSRAIVMLTKCIEKGREKCDHYWPYDTQPVYYGDIQVTILNESKYLDWTISEFKVMRDEQSRIVRHFHFTTWPDFGVPEPPVTLVKFVRAFRERVLPDSSKPIVVHCSAGVGRSGTFIALDRILQHIQLHDYVDIFGIVYEMRKERVWMVQNEQQYICIHQCLLSVLEGKDILMDSPRGSEIHDNQGYEDDEGIAESGI